MGLSGMILKKGKSTDIHKLINDINMATINAGLEPRIDLHLCESGDGGVYTTGNIADTYDDIPEAQQWLMYIYLEDDWLNGLNHPLKHEIIMRSIIIENFSGCEKILLDFLFEYLKLNPEDYFYDELKWYYTYEDVVRIKQQKFDPDWCYKNPNLEINV